MTRRRLFQLVAGVVAAPFVAPVEPSLSSIVCDFVRNDYPLKDLFPPTPRGVTISSFGGFVGVIPKWEPESLEP